MIQKISVTFFLLLVAGAKLHAQNPAIYQLVLIETKGPFEQQAFVLIDSAGTIKSEKNRIGEKSGLTNLSAAVKKFIDSVHPKKIAANNNVNREVRDAKNGERCLNLYLITLADFNSEAEFKNKSYYHYVDCQPAENYNANNYELFKFLDVETANRLIRFLQ